ncbi:hypothetical protein GCM10008910_45480 [Faecalicatena orotica]|uniref:Uncharacterized protein n=1 Tax=Faecalicatena orotica TaxID=1544 RepID=A0A2Y9BER6_9FIRM|nr:hypothetical protein [Faecalicatena orotica]PWJ29508.1 hypothetical protein A8806_106247 [Faecalicatena orotica]SSA55963.1 hypothetical protein SAMN05216536_106247 [Faecalicatena orotica]
MSAKTIMMKRGKNDFFPSEQTFDVITNDIGLKQVRINGNCFIVPQPVATFIDNMFDVVSDLEEQLDKQALLRKEDLMKKSVSIAAGLMGGNERRIRGKNLLKKDFHDSSDEGYQEFYTDVIKRIQNSIEDIWTPKERGETVEKVEISPNNAKWRD